jgi:hypothetical protein
MIEVRCLSSSTHKALRGAFATCLGSLQSSRKATPELAFLVHSVIIDIISRVTLLLGSPKALFQSPGGALLTCPGGVSATCPGGVSATCLHYTLVRICKNTQ